jgi:hypothetical protein
MGPAKMYIKDFYTLRVRSKQLFVESPICQAIIGRFTGWVIGRNLRLCSEPQKEVLSREGIDINTEDFNRNMEGLWKVCANGKLMDYSNGSNLPAIMEMAHIEGKLGGDVLVILRVINGIVRVQLIDGGHVGNPPTKCNIDYADKNIASYQGAQGFEYIYEPTGNRIRKGVEIDKKGEHVAFHVRVGVGLEYERISAKDSKGFVRAYMYYGFKPDLNETRGTPLLSVVMEQMKILERYLKSAVSGAEERAKVPYFFEHKEFSVEDDPQAGIRAKSLVAQKNPPSAVAADMAIDALGNQMADKVAVSMEKQVYNLPRGVTVNAIDNDQNLTVEEFGMFNIKLICAAVKIPPNVAMSEYNDSFSASRMAGKDWEHTFLAERDDFSQQFLNPIYALQMYIWVLENKVSAPGYLQRLANKNEIAIAAYTHTRWEGDMFPDIDPLKTANYLRVMMGDNMAHMPLMTSEVAANIGGQGEYAAILKQAGDEKNDAESAGFKQILKAGQSDGEKTGEGGEGKTN